jgi:hypothetical protein
MGDNRLDHWLEWENKYHRTRNIKYAVLALGKWGRTAPDWAFLACSEYFQAEERRSISGRCRNDDKLLDRMAKLIISGSAKTKHEAAQRVTGDETNGSNIHRLLRLWDDEQKAAEPGIEKPRPWWHPRCERASVRRAKQHGNFLGPYNPYNAPPPDPEDDKLLDRMAELIISGSAKTEHAAARRVIGGVYEINRSKIQCLLRLWDAECKAAKSPEPWPWSHPRCERAAVTAR